MSSSEETETDDGTHGPARERVQVDRAGSPVPSCLSMKSDHSLNLPINLRGEVTGDQRIHCSPASNRFVERSSEKLFSKQLTSSPVKQKDLADSLERDEQHNKSIERAQKVLKTALKKKFECIFEGLAKQGHPTLLNEIYTELYIIKGGHGGINDEHEVRQIETASKRNTTQETAILCNGIFKPLPGQERPIRTVLTKGIAGIGKTVSVQKFILDWAEGKANQDIDFIFTLPFRDLNLKKERKFSLMQLLQHYFPQLKEIKSVEGDGVKVVFIFDGLDECRLPLDFQSNKNCCDITESSSVDGLLTNLIKGNLLPSALLWITSRPAAANRIPPEWVHQATEVRGFNDPQKEEYFRKKIGDQNQASRIISHIKSSRSLYIMCHIPVVCLFSATVLGTMLGETESGDLPKTLTEMYTHFLLIQTNVKNQKYHDANEMNPKKVSESDREIILKLGWLAFRQLEKGNLIFYEEDLRESGIDASEASEYSRVYPEIFKEECGLDQEKTYCFVHLSIQEYLAALYVFHSCVNVNRNVLRAEESKPHSGRVELSEVHRSAVDQALKSKNGHLDLFLRFLLGLSLDSIQTLLGRILTKKGSTHVRLHSLIGLRRGSRSKSIEKTVQYIKEKIREESSAERTINLFHCLYELNDNSLVEEIQNSLRSGTLSDKELEPDQFSALAFVLLTSKEVLDEFDLRTYNTSAVGYLRLVPVVRNCRKAILSGCDLTEKSCEIVASALQSSNSPLRDLDLSYNNLGDSGVKLLCAGLMSPNYKLQSLDLSYNNLGDSGVELLCAALMSPNCKLQRLDLSYNYLGDSGVELLCAALMSPNCKLQTLGLGGCGLTEKSCEIVASALQSLNSPLRDLDLSYNNLGDSGVKQLCAGQMSPNYTLQSLGLGWCNLTEGCCDDLASVLHSPHSELRDLELRDNELQDSGVRALSAGLEDPHCKLQRLGLSGCQVTERGCASLASALRSNPSHLRELDLSYNNPGESGVTALSAGLEDPSCRLLVDHRGETRLKPGLRKYAVQLTLDPNTAHRKLSLSEGNRRVIWGDEQPCPDHPKRFSTYQQVLCREGLSERCYWEAEWSVEKGGKLPWVAMAFKTIGRKGRGDASSFGHNDKSWSLYCSKQKCSAIHKNTTTDITAPPSPFCRVGVYLDWPAGTLSFYSVSSDTRTLLHTFHTTFTEPLYPGFKVNKGNSVTLCMLG